MEKIKVGSGFDLEQGESGEYILKFKLPKIGSKVDDLSGGHFKQAQKEILLAVRSIIDKALKTEE